MCAPVAAMCVGVLLSSYVLAGAGAGGRRGGRVGRVLQCAIATKGLSPPLDPLIPKTLILQCPIATKGLRVELCV